MTNRFRSPLNVTAFFLFTLFAGLLLADAGFSQDTYSVPQTAEVTLAWDANDPAPEGYRIYQRAEGDAYDYSQPVWTGSATTGTVYNLLYDTTYYFVVRAYEGTLESADSEEVTYSTPASPVTSYIITASAGTGGSISPAGTLTVEDGASQTFSITPFAGYQVASVTVDGVDVGAVAAYTFDAVSGDHTINASFVATYQITASAGAGGAISPSGTISVAAGGSQSYTITPDSGFSIADVIVDGAAMTPQTTYTFSGVNADHTISATFAADTYTLNAVAGTGGTITPAGQVTVNSGASQTFTVTAETGYEIEDLLVNGSSMGAQSSYTLENIQADYTVEASFALANQAPIADAGPDQTVAETRTVTLSGLNSVDLDDGIATFVWRQIQGIGVVLSAQDHPEVTFMAPDVDSQGASLVFELAVTDYSGVTSVDTCIVNVTWVNVPPTADAGGAQTVSQGDTVVLDATGSTDPDDGIVAYLWQQVEGPVVTLSSNRSATASFTAPDTGIDGASLVFQLTVTDAGGLQDTDSNLITVEWVNQPPLANAGPDQTANVGDTVVLDGSLSTDTDEDTIVSYRWRQTDGLPVELSDATADAPTFITPDMGTAGGTLTFELTVTDSGGMLDKDTCQVVVAGSEPADTTAPTLTIENPSETSLHLRQATMSMSGSAWDDQAVTRVIWSNSRGGSGVAVGTTQWVIANIELSKGPNTITVSAVDAAGNTTSMAIEVKAKP